jgi:hypothetical protein
MVNKTVSKEWVEVLNIKICFYISFVKKLVYTVFIPIPFVRKSLREVTHHDPG